MPKNEIDYSSTIIYKIICKDKSINDVYVGHTTSFIKRKYQHKVCCNNLNNNLNIYKTIRVNGGWDNWEMIQIACYNCKNSEEARIKEQEHYEELNSVPPYVDKMQKYCEICKIQCYSFKKYNSHIVSNCHKKKLNDKNCDRTNRTNKMPENAKTYYCQKCDFKCCKQSNYDIHLLTAKHKNRTLLNNNELQIMPQFECNICNKTYSARNSLWYHKQKCKNAAPSYENIKENEETNVLLNKDQLIQYLIKENSEFKELIVEQNKMVMKMCEKSVSTINNINSHNKTFNLNVFLNEHCKDAMNITDFVDSLKLQLSDLESVGKLGFVEGISNIIVKNLKALDIHKRPVHCSDSKREVMYIKDADKWEKENEEKNKLRKAIKKIANKNSRLIPAFKEKHPDCGKSESKFSDQYNKLIVEAMGGSGNEDFDNENKIIKKIAKEVIIDKNAD